MGELVIAGLIVVIAIIGFAMLGDVFLYWLKGNCTHKWNPWGDLIEDKQYRQCSKCKMIDRREI